MPKSEACCCAASIAPPFCCLEQDFYVKSTKFAVKQGGSAVPSVAGCLAWPYLNDLGEHAAACLLMLVIAMSCDE
jgi:hypothetical protein